MNILKIYQKQLEHVKRLYQELISDGKVIYTDNHTPHKLRINLIDGSIIDIFYSISGKYSYHWERRTINGSLYRHDNAPHSKWRTVNTFPKHFHYKTNTNVIESNINKDPIIAIEEFFEFIKQTLIELHDL
ncbi:hypothetical protein MHK_002250 [Candidatus Magnetomorum sp. HK-1]|nr:hypothetical protein MHK_002250 [Candidatus Magnetomorum sp. HK-1]